jgi:hypothetical protein
VRECQHPVRRRDNNSGFASAETFCVDCGQVFDAERENELRIRDQGLGGSEHHTGQGEGHGVG